MTRTKSFAMTGRKRSPYDEKWKTSERGEREGLAMRGREGSWDEGKERVFPNGVIASEAKQSQGLAFPWVDKE